MASPTDTSGIQLINYEVTYDGVTVGFTTNESTTVNIEQEFARVDDAESVGGLIKMWVTGKAITVVMQLKDASPSQIASLAMQDVTTIASGADRAYQIPNTTTLMVGKELILHPSADDAAVQANDWMFWKAIPTSNLALTGSRTGAQVLDITFEIVPDFTKGKALQMGIFGSRSISQGTPFGVFLQSRNIIAPYLHIPAIALDDGSTAQIDSYYGISGGVTDTLDLDDVGNLAADRTVVSMTYDALTTANILQAGVILSVNGGTEFMYVVSNVPATSTTGTVTIVRAIAGTTLQIISDNATIDVIDDPGFLKMTESTDNAWASSAAANVTVGNVFSSSSNTKGQIAHVLAGSSNITSTFATVASPSLVATAN